MIKKLLLIFFLVIFSIDVLADTTPTANHILLCYGKKVLGRVEKVILIDKNLAIDAKLDTGAAMSSLSATDIATFINDKNEILVQFTLFVPSKHEKITLVEPLVKTTNILNRKEETEDYEGIKTYSQRFVVKLPIKLGNQTEVILVNLTDRTDFRYPMLLGSDALKKFNIIVDASQRYLVQ